MSRPRDPKYVSQDDFRKVLRLAKKASHAERVSISIRKDSRRRLNWLRDHHFKSDDQSMAIDLACLRLTGSLEPWEERS